MDSSIKLLHASDLHFSDTANRLNFIDHWHQDVFEIYKSLFPTKVSCSLFRPTSFCSTVANGFRDFLGLIGNPQDIRCFVITGDVATTADERDLRAALSYLTEHPGRFESSVRPPLVRSIDIFRDRTFLLPGNHDRYCAIKKTKLEVQYCKNNFNAVFKNYNYWGSDEYIFSYPIKDQAGNEVLAIIGLDCSPSDASKIKGKINRWAQGIFSNTEMADKLREETRKYHERHIPVIWATHYLPLGNDKVKHYLPSGKYKKAVIGNHLKLHNDKELLDLALELDIRLILSGHVHKCTLHKYTNTTNMRSPSRSVTVISSGCTTCLSTDNSFNTIDLKLSGAAIEGIGLAHYRYKCEEGRFEKAWEKSGL